MAAQGLDSSFQIILQREDVAAEDAHFWVAASQYDLGELTNSRSTYQDYLNRYESARWTDAVQMMLAQIALAEGDPETATNLLQSVSQTSSLKKAAVFLQSRIAGPTSTESEQKNEEAPKESEEEVEKKSAETDSKDS